MEYSTKINEDQIRVSCWLLLNVILIFNDDSLQIVCSEFSYALLRWTNFILLSFIKCEMKYNWWSAFSNMRPTWYSPIGKKKIVKAKRNHLIKKCIAKKMLLLMLRNYVVQILRYIDLMSFILMIQSIFFKKFTTSNDRF